MAPFLFLEVDAELAQTHGKWVRLSPKTAVDGDRGPVIRITLKVLQEAEPDNQAFMASAAQAFMASAPLQDLAPVVELEVV